MDLSVTLPDGRSAKVSVDLAPLLAALGAPPPLGAAASPSSVSRDTPEDLGSVWIAGTLKDGKIDDIWGAFGSEQRAINNCTRPGDFTLGVKLNGKPDGRQPLEGLTLVGR